MQRLRNLFQCTAFQCGGCSAPPKTVCGIGAVLEPNEFGELEIVELVPGGAAEQSGLLQVGDILHEVDGVDMYKLPASEVGEFIRGEVGTAVSLGVAKRKCASRTVYIETVEIVRAETLLPEKRRSERTIAWESSGSGSSSSARYSLLSPSSGGNSNTLASCDAAGIGAVLTKTDQGEIEFTQVARGGAAEASGMIDVGDSLIEVDGINIEKKELAEVGSMIRGEPGSTVCLGIAKEKDKENLVFPVIIRDCPQLETNGQKRVTNLAAKAAKAAFVSFDLSDVTLREPDLKHRSNLVLPVSMLDVVPVVSSEL